MGEEDLHRPAAALQARAARESLSRCLLCAFRCGVDRTGGPAGLCRTDARSRVFHEGIEWAGEEVLVPTFVVSLSGCNMSCSFCLTGESSQNGRAGTMLDASALGLRIRASAGSLRSVTILGGEPSIHLDGALEIAARIPRNLPLVWKTNAYASPEGLSLLEGIPDVVLADYKFGNDACAARLANVPRYTEIVRENLHWAARTSRLLVRHLAMPGHLECCLAPVAEWLARRLPGTPLSLMTGFLPTFRAAGDSELGRTNREAERRRAAEIVRACGVPLAPWVLAPVPAASAGPVADDLWIDRQGRICVDSASAELVGVLKRLGDEFVPTL
ncbi:MAG TPA: radical SAM protein [Planctomycetota bacterium]|nr:radical SAM protein [Planctomycetota bacterium]